MAAMNKINAARREREAAVEKAEVSRARARALSLVSTRREDSSNAVCLRDNFFSFFGGLGNLQAEKILSVKAAEAEAEAKHLSGPKP